MPSAAQKQRFPQGAKFESNALLNAEGAPVRGETLYIGPASEQAEPFGSSIAGVPITKFNYQRLTQKENGAPVIPGLTLGQNRDLSYDPRRNILNMKNATIDTRGLNMYGIACDAIDGLIIALSGQNALYADLVALHVANPRPSATRSSS